MAEETGSGGRIREVVGLFARRDDFDAAVAALLDAGFKHADLSVLSSHQALEAADPPEEVWRERFAAMFGEVKYVGPLTAAGLIFLAGGPVAATIAAITAAGVGGMAVREALIDLAATPDTEEFQRALEAGAAILWVRVRDPEAERKAAALLEAHGGRDIRVREGPPHGSDAAEARDTGL